MNKIFYLLLILFTIEGCTIKNNEQLAIENFINEEIEFVLVDGSDTVEIQTTWEDKGAILLINNQSYNTVYSNDAPDTNKLGLYGLTYQTMYNNETYTLKRYVIVVDQTSPVITLNPGIDTIKGGSEWIDAKAIVEDNSLEDIDITIEGSVDIFNVGTYIISYIAYDSTGNTATAVRYINVVE